MPLDENDTVYLEHALALAELGRGCTSPNPIVGAVIVGDGHVVGEGYHAGPWRDHAEIAAMKNAGLSSPESFAGLTMYVTLEPCCIYGRTPPCTDALIAARFGRVVVGALDPSPAVDGKGIAQLRAAGIQVDMAGEELARRARRQNDGLRKLVTNGLPFVTYKYAMTLDGRVATDLGDTRWISSDESRARVHQMRAWSDAVMVGAGTLEQDDPLLTARSVSCERQPLRVVVDADLCLRRSSNLAMSAAEGEVLVVCAPDVDASRRGEVESWGVQTAAVARETDGRLASAEVARVLAERGVQTVLLEGGPRLAGAWWAAGLVDRITVFVCPCVVGGNLNRLPFVCPGVESMADSVRLQEVEITPVGPDVMISGYVRGPY